MKKILLFTFILLFLSGCNSSKPSNIEILNNILNSIDLPLETSIGLELKKTYDYEGATITATWSSSNEEILSPSGEIFRGKEDETVVLTVTLFLGDDYVTNSYDIVVLALEDDVIASKILDMLNIPTEINSNIPLNQSVKYDDNNYKVNWESSNKNVLSNKGVVIYQQEDTEVSLTATISYNKVKYSKTFKILVKAFDTTEMENYINSLTIPTEIAEDITLPNAFKSEKHNYNLSWNSSNPDILSNDGKIGITLTDTNITLTASISIDDVTILKEFNTIVKKSSNDQILDIIDDNINLQKTANSNIFLPTDLGNNIVCTWTSSDENIISSDGKFNPEFTGHKVITLTTNINIGGDIMTKEYNIIANQAEHFKLITTFEGTFEDTHITKDGKLSINDGEVIGTFISKEYDHSGFQKAVASWGALSNSQATCELLVSLKVGNKFSEYITYGEWGLGNQNKCIGKTKDLIKLTEDEIFVLNNKSATGFKFKIILRRFETNTPSPLVSLVAFSFEIKNYTYDFDKTLVNKGTIYDVPRLYQHEVPGIGGIICSATSSCMLLKYKGHNFSGINPLEHEYMAAMVKDYGNNIYGNWVYNCVAMSAYKETAYVKRFANTYEFLYSLQEIGPMAASIKGTVKYTKQDDGKAGNYYTAGHLLVVTGFEITDNGTFIYINDPNVNGVAIKQTLEDFLSVWRNVSYIIE